MPVMAHDGKGRRVIQLRGDPVFLVFLRRKQAHWASSKGAAPPVHLGPFEKKLHQSIMDTKANSIMEDI